ncbi:MAG: glycosyltransferase [Marinobacter sp.]
MGIDISVVTPVYNGEKYIRECIESVKDQRGVSIEHIVIDDGSGDETQSIVAEYPHVKYHRQQNAGANAARNHGLSLAKGRYIKFLDADDLLISSSLQRQFEIATGLGDKDISFGYSIALIEGKGESVRPPSIKVGESLDVLILNNIVTSLSLYPKSALDAVKGFSRHLHARQEWDLNLRLVANGFRFLFGDVLVYKQRFHDSPGRISNRKLDGFKELSALEKVYDNFPKPVSQKVKDAWAAYLWGVGRQLIYHDSAQDARLVFDKALEHSPRNFEHYLGWKYRVVRKLMGDVLPDILAARIKKFLDRTA